MSLTHALTKQGGGRQRGGAHRVVVQGFERGLDWWWFFFFSLAHFGLDGPCIHACTYDEEKEEEEHWTPSLKNESEKKNKKRSLEPKKAKLLTGTNADELHSWTGWTNSLTRSESDWFGFWAKSALCYEYQWNLK